MILLFLHTILFFKCNKRQSKQFFKKYIYSKIIYKNAISTDIIMLTDDTVLGDQVTVVIVPASAETLDEANIYYINQDAFGNKEAILVNMGIKGTELAKGDYLVKLGGSNGKIYTATFTVGEDGKYKLGDVNEDDSIDSSDASLVLQSYVNLIQLTDTQKLAADVNKDSDIDSSDASLILQHYVGLTVIK